MNEQVRQIDIISAENPIYFYQKILYWIQRVVKKCKFLTQRSTLAVSNWHPFLFFRWVVRKTEDHIFCRIVNNLLKGHSSQSESFVRYFYYLLQLNLELILNKTNLSWPKPFSTTEYSNWKVSSFHEKWTYSNRKTAYATISWQNVKNHDDRSVQVLFRNDANDE